MQLLPLMYESGEIIDRQDLDIGIMIVVRAVKDKREILLRQCENYLFLD